MKEKRKPGRPPKLQEGMTPEPTCDLATLGMRHIPYMGQKAVKIDRPGFGIVTEMKPAQLVRHELSADLTLDEARQLEAVFGKQKWVDFPGKDRLMVVVVDGEIKRRFMITKEIHEGLRSE